MKELIKKLPIAPFPLAAPPPFIHIFLIVLNSRTYVTIDYDVTFVNEWGVFSCKIFLISKFF